MRSKKLIIIPILFFQLFPFILWKSCRDFLEQYHFSVTSIEQQINFATSQDYALPASVARIFHNKLLEGLIDVYVKYTQFMDWQLFITATSFVGVFGFLYGIWYFLNQKNKDRRIIVLISLFFAVPLIEIIINPAIPFYLKLVIYFLPFHLVSLYGHYHFIKTVKVNKVLMIYFLLIFISILWMLNFPDLIYKYCAKI